MKNIKEQVDEIQEQLNDKSQNYDKYFLKYTQVGYVESVSIVILEDTFNIEVDIWDSENNQLSYIEKTNEYETFEKFLLRRIDDTVKTLKNLKTIIKDK